MRFALNTSSSPVCSLVFVSVLRGARSETSAPSTGDSEIPAWLASASWDRVAIPSDDSGVSVVNLETEPPSITVTVGNLPTLCYTRRQVIICLRIYTLVILRMCRVHLSV